MPRHVTKNVFDDLMIKNPSGDLNQKLRCIESKLKREKLSVIEATKLFHTAYSTLKTGKEEFPATIKYFEHLLRHFLTDGIPLQDKNEINGHKFVLMGDGLKWATCNVGASSPEGFGDYFAWGINETYYSSLDPLTWKDWVAEDGYSYLSNKYFKKTESDYLALKYTDEDGKTVLEPEDDAATANWGGSWRTPTEEEWGRLLNEDNFTWTWETKGDVKGYTVTSKVKGYEGNQIFLPAAGNYVGKTTIFQNVRCTYWSSSLAMQHRLGNRLYSMVFKSDKSSKVIAFEGRYMGQSVRPVSK
ncbi:MAG: hypothetical protein IKI89_03970 [Bacteroidales bacterium]|nr:hypothetical protein [Bacteroidales bacterium]